MIATDESGLTLTSVIVTPSKLGLLADFCRIEESLTLINSLLLSLLTLAIEIQNQESFTVLQCFQVEGMTQFHPQPEHP